MQRRPWSPTFSNSSQEATPFSLASQKADCVKGECSPGIQKMQRAVQRRHNFSLNDVIDREADLLFIQNQKLKNDGDPQDNDGDNDDDEDKPGDLGGCSLNGASQQVSQNAVFYVKEFGRDLKQLATAQQENPFVRRLTSLNLVLQEVDKAGVDKQKQIQRYLLEEFKEKLEKNEEELMGRDKSYNKSTTGSNSCSKIQDLPRVKHSSKQIAQSSLLEGSQKPAEKSSFFNNNTNLLLTKKQRSVQSQQNSEQQTALNSSNSSQFNQNSSMQESWNSSRINDFQTQSLSSNSSRYPLKQSVYDCESDSVSERYYNSPKGNKTSKSIDWKRHFKVRQPISSLKHVSRHQLQQETTSLDDNSHSEYQQSNSSWMKQSPQQKSLPFDHPPSPILPRFINDMKESILAINSYNYTDNAQKEDSNIPSINTNQGNILKSSMVQQQQQQHAAYLQNSLGLLQIHHNLIKPTGNNVDDYTFDSQKQYFVVPQRTKESNMEIAQKSTYSSIALLDHIYSIDQPEAYLQGGLKECLNI